MGIDNSDSNESFEQLMRPHLAPLFRVAIRLTGNRSEADDLFQDVLTKLYLRQDDLADLDAPGPWLKRVLYNHFVDNRRRYKRRSLVVVAECQLHGSSVESVAGTSNPQHDAELAETGLALQKALAMLSEEHRVVVMLHDAEGYKLSEIQELTGDPVGTIKSRLHRARARLRELLLPELPSDGTIS